MYVEIDLLKTTINYLKQNPSIRCIEIINSPVKLHLLNAKVPANYNLFKTSEIETQTIFKLKYLHTAHSTAQK